MSRLVLGAIRLYQRFVSPYKGFGCAYRLHTGCASCSTLGYRAIRRHGLRVGLGLLGRRLDRCGEAHRRHRSHLNRRLDPQAGLCDLDCDLPCDALSGRGLSRALANCGSAACDFASCAPCDGCDWRRRRPTERTEKWVRVPPQRARDPARRRP